MKATNESFWAEQQMREPKVRDLIATTNVRIAATTVRRSFCNPDGIISTLTSAEAQQEANSEWRN